MKKRALSLFLNLVLCFTMMPGTVYAETTENRAAVGNGEMQEGTETAGNESKGNPNEEAGKVQELIDLLPTLESLKTADEDEVLAGYEVLQEAYDAYLALADEQQELISGTDCFEILFSWFNDRISLLGGQEGSDQKETCQHTSGASNITIDADDTVTCTECGQLEASVTVNGSQIFYRTLSEAVAAAEENASITLHKDVVLQSDLTIDKKEVTLDLRQRTLSLDNCNLRIAAEEVSIISGYPDVSEMGKIQQNTSGATLDSTKGYVIVGGGTESASLYLRSGTVEKVSVENNGYFSMDQSDEPRDQNNPDSEPWYTKVGTLCQSGSGKVYLDGGSITKGISGSITIQEMLGDLHGLQYEGGTWLKAEVLDGKTLTLTDGSSVKSVESPLNMLEMDSYSTETEYGSNFTPDIRVSVNRAEGYEDKTVTYTWYLDDEKDGDCTGATYTFPEGKPVKTKQGATEAEDTVEPYVVKCVAACEGYERSVSTEITVEKANLLGAIIVIRGTANTYSSTYNAKSQDIQEQMIVVMLRYDELTEDTDYVIDTEASDLTATEVGSYVFKIKAARGGNYTGEKEIEWNINPCVLTESDCTVEFEQDSFPYTGSEIEPKVKVTYTYGEETITIPAEEYTVDYLDNVEPGMATARIYNAEGGNYEVNGGGCFEIAKSELSPKPEVTIENWAYGDNSKLPGVTANPGYGDVEYYYNTTDSNQNGKVWDFSEVDALSPGDYYAYAVIGESTYYKACTTEAKKFTVEKSAASVEEWPTLKDIYVGDTLDDTYMIGGTGAEDAPGTFAVVSQGTSWGQSGEQTAVIEYRLTDSSDNYRDVTKQTVKINVKKRVVKSIGLQTAVTDKVFGTMQSELGLPATVNITTEDGKGFDNVPVTWDGYHASTLEPQTLTGTLNLTVISNEVQQPAQAVKAEIQVTLNPATAQQPLYKDKNVTYNGARQGNALAQPSEVASIKYEYEGTGGTVYPKSATAPMDVGSYTVTASFTMAYGYQQLAPVSAKLKIECLNLDGAEVILGPELVENGTTQTMTVSAVKVGEVTLQESDYIISGNTGVTNGRYEMTIIGTGNCTGEVTKEWYINEKKDEPAESETGTQTELESETAASTGWTDVNRMLQQTGTQSGSTDSEAGNVNVYISGSNVVPANVLTSLQGTELTLAMHQGNGIALSISGSYLNESNLSGLSMLDLTTDTRANTIPADVIREKNVAVSRQLTIKNTGRFPVKVDLHVNLGVENAGRYANFYRYNDKLGRLEYCGYFKIAENGQAMTSLGQGGSYLITVTDKIPKERYFFSDGMYTVKKGDTLSQIAAWHQITVKELLRKNPWIENINRIRPGQRIMVD